MGGRELIYHQTPDCTFRVGDVQSELASLPERSVHCVVTSIPYFGLRDYGLEPTIWDADAPCPHDWNAVNGGRLYDDQHLSKLDGIGRPSHHADARYGCAHEWDVVVTPAANGLINNAMQGETLSGTSATRRPRSSAFCRLCGAWRGQLGLEPTPTLYLQHIVAVFRAVWRVLRDDGTLWLNIGDSYNAYNGGAGPSSGAIHKNQDANRPTLETGYGLRVRTLKPKDLLLMPARIAIALQDDGWYVRSQIIWAKTSPMPESVSDRPTSAHETIWLLTKKPRYFYDADAVREASDPAQEEHNRRYAKSYDLALSQDGNGQPGNTNHVGMHARPGPGGRNLRNVWMLGPEPFSGWQQSAHRVSVEAHDADDDTTRIASPDCPVHGDQSHLAPMTSCGEREDDDLIRTEHNDDNHDQEQQGDCGPTDLIHVGGSEAESWDSPDPSCSQTATGHSTDSRKTHCPSEEHDTAFLRTLDRTGRTLSLGGSLEQDDCDTHGESETPDRTSRRPACTCSYYKEVTKKISHFATFVTEIPRRAILAGTSEAGCCATCGAPWDRVTEYHKPGDRGKHVATYEASGVLNRRMHPGEHNAAVHTTTGWRPTCTHAASTVPCTVLDCFGGSGTTHLVARELGRHSVYVDLSPTYADLAIKRLEHQTPMLPLGVAGQPLAAQLALEDVV